MSCCFLGKSLSKLLGSAGLRAVEHHHPLVLRWEGGERGEGRGRMEREKEGGRGERREEKGEEKGGMGGRGEDKKERRGSGGSSTVHHVHHVDVCYMMKW